MTEREPHDRDPWDPDEDEESAMPTADAVEAAIAGLEATTSHDDAHDDPVNTPDDDPDDPPHDDLRAEDEAVVTGSHPSAEASGSGESGVREGRRERPLVRKEYYSISEVADLVGLPAHVLRYWESQFSVLNPSKNRSGNRVYQRKEIRLILLVKQLLYEEKYTVEGAKQKLDQLRRGPGLPEATTQALDTQTTQVLREELRSLSEILAPDAD